MKPHSCVFVLDLNTITSDEHICMYVYNTVHICMDI